ncbi:hypothetical protein FWH13_02980 [Candidatus Saccharibacteria bacterium]|nr:hypothetical protein [Candidatus Saccharibacteria bacterium]
MPTTKPPKNQTILHCLIVTQLILFVLIGGLFLHSRSLQRNLDWSTQQRHYLFDRVFILERCFAGDLSAEDCPKSYNGAHPEGNYQDGDHDLGYDHDI